VRVELSPPPNSRNPELWLELERVNAKLAISETKGGGELFVERGRIYWELNRPAQAEADFALALQSNPALSKLIEQTRASAKKKHRSKNHE
jgi:hypothetical protein